MRLALIGVGMIGGSFARALRASGKVDQVVGFDTRSEALRYAIELGVIDRFTESAAHAVDQCEVVVIATPVGSTESVLEAIAPNLSPTAVVTDVGSTKTSVIEAGRHALGASFKRFVPGHPIAGREQSGVEYSDAALFRDKLFISTPVVDTDADATRHIEDLWRSVGSRVERMAPEEHDTIFAAVSHLPHLLAFALVAQIAADPDSERKFELAGAGFRDFTRIAASSPVMWGDICVANRIALGNELRQHRTVLAQLQRALDECDRDTLLRVFSESARRA